MREERGKGGSAKEAEVASDSLIGGEAEQEKRGGGERGQGAQVISFTARSAREKITASGDSGERR